MTLLQNVTKCQRISPSADLTELGWTLQSVHLLADMQIHLPAQLSISPGLSFITSVLSYAEMHELIFEIGEERMMTLCFSSLPYGPITSHHIQTSAHFGMVQVRQIASTGVLTRHLTGAQLEQLAPDYASTH